MRFQTYIHVRLQAESEVEAIRSDRQPVPGALVDDEAAADLDLPSVAAKESTLGAGGPSLSVSWC